MVLRLCLRAQGVLNHDSLWERWLRSRVTVLLNLRGALWQRAVQQCRSGSTAVGSVVDGNDPAWRSALEKAFYFAMRCSCNGGMCRVTVFKPRTANYTNSAIQIQMEAVVSERQGQPNMALSTLEDYRQFIKLDAIESEIWQNYRQDALHVQRVLVSVLSRAIKARFFSRLLTSTLSWSKPRQTDAMTKSCELRDVH
ncbi:hypothetical protein AX14_008143 [Amanita brunnescens Koide BX004]|nr:hypothetical protein AX14_008143 [Amanita brunnescens Koide BX004]